MVGFSMPSAHPQLVGLCRASEWTHDLWDSVATVSSLRSSVFDGTLSPSVFPPKVGLVSYSMCTNFENARTTFIRNFPNRRGGNMLEYLGVVCMDLVDGMPVTVNPATSERCRAFGHMLHSAPQ